MFRVSNLIEAEDEMQVRLMDKGEFKPTGTSIDLPRSSKMILDEENIDLYLTKDDGRYIQSVNEGLIFLRMYSKTSNIQALNFTVSLQGNVPRSEIHKCIQEIFSGTDIKVHM